MSANAGLARVAARKATSASTLRAAARSIFPRLNGADASVGSYNLADLLDDQGRSEAAVECLRKAVVVACSIWRYYCNGKARMAKLRIIGGGI